MDKHLAQKLYGQLLNEHRRITNEISDIRAANYELPQEDKKKIEELQGRQVTLMNQMKTLFNN
jgi:hypothetical protein